VSGGHEPTPAAQESQVSQPKTFKWTVEFEIAHCLVEDGFEMTDAVAQGMIEERLSYAYEGELKARVVNAPTKKSIAKAQGY
jgi:hypothetical protein